MIKTDKLSEVFFVCFFLLATAFSSLPLTGGRFFGGAQNKFHLCPTFQAPAAAITASCASVSRCSCCKLFVIASFMLAFGRGVCIGYIICICIISFE